jgi:hypothetical protein
VLERQGLSHRAVQIAYSATSTISVLNATCTGCQHSIILDSGAMDAKECACTALELM